MSTNNMMCMDVGIALRQLTISMPRFYRKHGMTTIYKHHIDYNFHDLESSQCIAIGDAQSLALC